MLSRQDTHNLLLAQMNSLDLKVITVYSQWLWRVEADDLEHSGQHKQYTAVILPSSFDWWTKRYHLAKSKPTMVICYEHNSCVNVPVLSLHDGVLYAPCRWPNWFHDYGRDRATHRGKQVFLGALLSGVGEAFDVLDDLPRPTKYRYQNDLKLLRRHKQGRPVEGRKEKTS